MILYVINSKHDSRYKIGICKNLEKRLQSLQSGNPSRLKVVRKFTVLDTDASKLESELHRRLAQFNVGGEWFALYPAAIRWLNALSNKNGKITDCRVFCAVNGVEMVKQSQGEVVI